MSRDIHRHSDGLNYIQDLANGYQKSKILFTACELDIFTVICDGKMSSEEIAEKVGADERAIDRLCNALVSLNLLTKTAAEFSNTEDSRELLVIGSDRYMGNLHHISNQWDAWSDLVHTVREGKPKVYSTLDERSEEWLDAFTESYYWKSKAELPVIIDNLDFSHTKRLLDLGGGTAHYAIEFAKKYPNLEVTIFDYDRMIDRAEKYIAKEGMQDRVKTIRGDFFEDEFGEKYDAVYISYVLHNFSIWDNVYLLQKVFESMSYGGELIINDVLIDDKRTSPLNSTLFSLHMLTNTLSGDSYTETDFWIMLREAWFKDIKRIDTELDSSLILAKR